MQCCPYSCKQRVEEGVCDSIMEGSHVNSWKPSPRSHGEHCWAVKAVASASIWACFCSRWPTERLFDCAAAPKQQQLLLTGLLITIPPTTAWLAALCSLRSMQRMSTTEKTDVQRAGLSSITVHYFINTCLFLLQGRFVLICTAEAKYQSFSWTLSCTRLFSSFH